MSKVKYLNFAITKSAVNIFNQFFFHVNRRTIDMEHNISNEGSSLKVYCLGPIPWVDFVGGAKVKNQLKHTGFMLHIKFKGMKR